MISNDGENLVFLLCLPRSGSTMLSLLLGSHSGIFCPPEPWFLLKLWALPRTGNINSPFDDEWATMATNQFLQEDTFIEAARAFATTAYNRYLLTANKTMFIDKTPRYYHILAFLDTVFPNARKIWLKRDLLDVALSYRKSWGTDSDIITGRRVSTASFDFAVAPFRLASYFDEPSPHKLEIQYETLVRSPAESLRDICRFLGVEFEQTMLDYANNEAALSQYTDSIVGDRKVLSSTGVHTQSIGKWATGLPLTETRQLVELLGFDIFRRMGYLDTIDALHAIGITECSETEAAEARRRVSDAKVDKMDRLYEELATLRQRLRSRRPDSRFLRMLRRILP